VLSSALKQILVVTIHTVKEIFKNVIDEMTYRTNLKLVNLFDGENGNFTLENVNSSID